MTWVEFATKAAFIAWHETVCTDRGLPKPGGRQSDAKEMLEHQWTVAAVRPVLDGTTLKALVPAEWVATYSLTATSAPVTTTTAVLWDAEVDKPLPDTWGGKPVPRPIVVVK